MRVDEACSQENLGRRVLGVVLEVSWRLGWLFWMLSKVIGTLACGLDSMRWGIDVESGESDSEGCQGGNCGGW